jgi:hypothetical protein
MLHSGPLDGAEAKQADRVAVRAAIRSNPEKDDDEKGARDEDGIEKGESGRAMWFSPV